MESYEQAIKLLKLLFFTELQGTECDQNKMIYNKDIVILGIESSCDDTSASILRNQVMLSNEVAGQAVHKAFGGVVPELASRAHLQNIIPVVDLYQREEYSGRRTKISVFMSAGLWRKFTDHRGKRSPGYGGNRSNH